MFEMKIIKISTFEMSNRKTQTITLRKTDDSQEFLFVVNKKIDLSEFKRGDKVLVTFEISRKGSLESPHFYITKIEKNVILMVGENANV